MKTQIHTNRRASHNRASSCGRNDRKKQCLKTLLSRTWTIHSSPFQSIKREVCNNFELAAASNSSSLDPHIPATARAHLKLKIAVVDELQLPDNHVSFNSNAKLRLRSSGKDQDCCQTNSTGSAKNLHVVARVV